MNQDLNQNNLPNISQNNESNIEKPITNQQSKMELKTNPPKKKDIAIVMIIAFLVLGLVLAIIFSTLSDTEKDSNKEENKEVKEEIDNKEEIPEENDEEKEEEIEDEKEDDPITDDDKNKTPKTITYYNNQSIKVTDKIAFTLDKGTTTGNAVLIGMKESNISSNFKLDSIYLKNEYLEVKDYNLSRKLEFNYKKAPIRFELNTETYRKDSTGEYLGNQLILHKDKNFIIIKGNKQPVNNDEPFSLYYRYGQSNNNWDLLFLGTGLQLTEMKSRIQGIRTDFDICTYDKTKGPSTCMTESNQKMNYNEYKNFYDVVIDTLIEYGLYVDNYKNITEMNVGTIYIEKYIYLEGANGNDKARFLISYHPSTKEIPKVILKTKLNGYELKLTKPYNSHDGYLETPNGCLKILTVIPSGAPKTEDNAIKLIYDTFSKS